MKQRSPLLSLVLDALRVSTEGSVKYHLWMGTLTFVMVLGAAAYTVQLQQGLAVTGMSDHVSWGLYISNFTFLVGLAAAAVMLVTPAYVMHDVDFDKAVLLGEAIAVGALVMCLAFVTVDMGGPQRLWHMIPGIGYFNWPSSMLTWDVLVLNGYLLLNLLIPFYLIFSHYRGRKPNPRLYLPFVMLSVFWAISIHLVTAFLYSGLPARPFWNSSLLGPRFLASAFAAGPAFMVVVIQFIRRHSAYDVQEKTLHKLALIATVAAQVNLIMLASELFKEFYYPTEHSASALYLFFGLEGFNGLTGLIWFAISLNVLATAALMVHPIRRNLRTLVPACMALFLAVYLEKGMGLIVPGFIPSPLGEIREYTPSLVEILVTLGIWSLGFFVMTLLVRVGIAVETGRMRFAGALPAAKAEAKERGPVLDAARDTPPAAGASAPA